MEKKLNISILVFVFIFLFSFPNPAQSHKHFVLVHGAGHGAWCWYKLASLMKSSGYNVTAFDLAASGIDPRQENELTSISIYFQPLTDFMEALPANQKVILVGHSYGGLALAKAMENFPRKISVAVFASAMMPGPTLNISTINQEIQKRIVLGPDTTYTHDNGPNKPATSYLFGPQTLASVIYQLSPIEDLTLASTVIRSQRLFTEEDTNKELELSLKNYGSVKRVFIMSEKDLAFKKDFQEWMIKKNKPNKVVEIKGSDHMVMISKPFQLWIQLQRISQEFY